MTHATTLRILLLFGTVVAASPAGAVAQDGPPADTAPRASAVEESLHGTVSGRVLSAVGRIPLERAGVLLRDDGRTLRWAATDAEGRYRFDRLAGGPFTLSVHTADHAPWQMDVDVPAGAELRVDVVLELDPPVLAPLLAVGTRSVLSPEAMTAAGEAAPGRPADPGLRSLDIGPGGGLLAGALRDRGEPPPSEPRGALFVRGAASETRRVYLDGAPVRTPFHLGGLMDAAPKGVLRSVRLYAGEAPLAYDAGLSYVLDLRTRSGGAEERTAGRLDLLGGSLLAEGGGERVSWLASGRRTHGDAASWIAGGELPYGYREALGRLDLRLGERDRLALTAFTNEESVRLRGAGDRPAPEPRAARWGNEALSLRFGTELGRTTLLATAAVSGFATELPASGELDRLAASEVRHARLAVDATTDAGDLSLAYGAAFDGRRLGLDLPPGEGVPAGRWRADAGTGSLYGTATFRAGPVVSFTGGVRAAAFGDGVGARVAPRLSVLLRPDDATRLELGAGRFHQRLGFPESALAAGTDPWPALTVASASHLNLRLDHRAEKSLSLGFEGYLKTFDGLAAGRDLRTSGAEVWADWVGEGWRAWGSYSLAWSWPDAPSDSSVGSRGRQLASAGGEVELPSGFRVRTGIRASSGLPFTRVPIVPDAGSPSTGVPPSTPEPSPEAWLGLADGPTGSYLRLDLSVSRRWSVDLFGRPAGLTPYVRILNALDRRDALFYRFDPAGELRPRALDRMPLLPVVGISWEVG